MEIRNHLYGQSTGFATKNAPGSRQLFAAMLEEQKRVEDTLELHGLSARDARPTEKPETQWAVDGGGWGLPVKTAEEYVDEFFAGLTDGDWAVLNARRGEWDSMKASDTLYELVGVIDTMKYVLGRQPRGCFTPPEQFGLLPKGAVGHVSRDEHGRVTGWGWMQATEEEDEEEEETSVLEWLDDFIARTILAQTDAVLANNEQEAGRLEGELGLAQRFARELAARPAGPGSEAAGTKQH